MCHVYRRYIGTHEQTEATCWLMLGKHDADISTGLNYEASCI